MAQKKIANEQLIAALIQHGTIKAAAAAAGCGERTFYERMQEREFRALYAEAKNDILRTAVFNINGKLAAAVDSMADIMTDKENPPAVRLQAAQAIINNAERITERLARDEYDSREIANPTNIFDMI